MSHGFDSHQNCTETRLPEFVFGIYDNQTMHFNALLHDEDNANLGIYNVTFIF